MNRKLLPYEHDLIQTLGVSKEEYLDFLAAQLDYSQSPEDRQAVIRAEPVAITSLVLAVVGILFQVASVLLMPRPDLGSQRNQRRPRDQRFSPRFGFNSTQELAAYGDTINLIYCNTEQNPKGAVRAATSLVWSSVESYGSSQFMQLMLVLGAAKVKRIDFDRVAFGQLPLGEFSASKTWLYYDEDGRVKFNDKVIGDGKDPTRDGAPGTDDVCMIIDGGRRREGYSQAFSPSSLTSIGVYSPIPINVEVQERKTSGKPAWANIGIKIQGESWQTGGDNKWSVGDKFTLVFQEALKSKDKIAQEAAKELRYQLVSSLDSGSTYMLGTAKFKLVSISDNLDLDDNDVKATFECIEAGRRPLTDYDREKAKIWDEKDREELEDAEDILKAPYEENTQSGPVTLKGGNVLYYRTLEGITDQEEYNKQNIQIANFEIKFAGVRYNFSGEKTLEWKNELDDKDSYTVPRGGSIAYTKKLLERFLANKPKLSTAKLRDELEDDLEKARALRDRIMSGDFDKQLRKDAKENPAVKAIQKEIERMKDELESRITEVYKFKPELNGDNLLKKGTELKVDGKDIGKLEKELERRRDDRDDIINGEIADKRTAYVRFIRDSNGPFRGLDDNRYAGGIRYIKKRLNKIKGEFTTDQIGVSEVRNYFRELISQKEEALKFAQYVTKNWEDLAAAADDHFYTKCLVKADYAAYQTITACDYVKFAIRCKLFRRVSGRQKKYGEKDAPDGYKISDNGVKGRMAFFKVLYRSSPDARLSAVPIIFAVRRSADLDNFIGLNFQGDKTRKWEFRFEPIGDIGAEIRQSGQDKFAFIENSGKRDKYIHDGNEFSWVGKLVKADGLLKPALEERGPLYTNEWDLFSNRSDTQIQFSFDNGPEFAITAVTEQQLGSVQGKYNDMSVMAFGVYSGRGVQDLRSITAYVLEGKSCWKINDDTGEYRKTDSSSSYAPDIFADTVLDTNDGIGKFAKPEGIDWESLALAKRFCKDNGLGCELFMDGVIAEQQSWRQFWAEVAPYSLLEFARIGGREALIPAIPTARSGRANREVNISALFNQGNILEGSYKEEFLDYGSSVQDLIATVIYRETERQDVFPRNASVQVMLDDVSEDTAIRQTFDISQFVTQREQAILFGKLLCNQRRWVRRGIEFRTFPTDSPISPGAYIYVDIGLKSWDRITSGIVMASGFLNAPLTDGIPDGSYSVLVYKSGERVRTLDDVAVSNGAAAALAAYEGYLFVLGTKVDRKRVFRVTEVQMDEEGEVSVKAMEHPCQDVDGKLLSRIANFSNALFSVR
jgi:hypothetical protein